MEQARQKAEHRIFHRWTRPADGDRFTEVEPPKLVWVPYWRLAVSLSGKMVVSYRGSEARPEGWIVEHHEDGLSQGGVAAIPVEGLTGYAMLCARTDIALASFFQLTTVDAPPWHVRADELVAFDDAAAILGPQPHLVDADVTPGMVHGRARRLCIDELELGQRNRTLWKPPTVEPVITHFVYVPHYWVSYAYSGEASPDRSRGFYVAVHGRSGNLVGEQHPSKLRAVAGRIRRLLSFDV
jgi:hypothetical protein